MQCWLSLEYYWPHYNLIQQRSMKTQAQQLQQQIKMPRSPQGCHAKLQSALHSWVAPHLPAWGFWSGRRLHFYFVALQIGPCCCRLVSISKVSCWSLNSPLTISLAREKCVSCSVSVGDPLWLRPPAPFREWRGYCMLVEGPPHSFWTFL